MHKQHTRQCSHSGMRAFWRLALPLAVSAWLAACNTPIGVAPNYRGTYLEHALVTNPNGGGPQIIIWGPPENSNPESR
jgi:hypothetical protein